MTRDAFAALPFVAALLQAGSRAPAARALAAPDPDGFVFAQADFVRRATLPYRHRQAFASRALGGGLVLHVMANALRAYDSRNGFARGPGQLHAAAVLYGTSLLALVNASAWNALGVAPFLQRLGELPAGDVRGNPFFTVAETLSPAHTTFFVCNNALHDLAAALAAEPGTDAGKTSAAQAYATLRDALLPRAMLVPAGVAAVNALQEYRFTLFQATV